MTYGPLGGLNPAGGYGFGITGGRESATGLNSQYGGFSYSKPSGWSDEDYAQAVAAVAAEVSHRGNVLDMARIADVIANREALGRYGKTVTEVIQAPKQFSAATSTRAKEKPARDIFDAVLNAVRTGDIRAATRLGVADRINAAKAAIDGVKVTGDLRGIAKGATAYDNKVVTTRDKTGAYHRGLERDFGSFTVGGHTFTGSRKDGFNPNLPDINPNAYATNYSDLRDWQGPETALAAGRAAARSMPDEAFRDFTDVLANEQLGVPDLPGPLAGMAPPEFSLQGLGDWSTGLAYDNLTPNPPDYSDITKGITHGGTPYGFTDAVTSTMEPNTAVYNGGPYDYGVQPDYSGITEGIMHDAYPSNPYGAEPLGAPQGFGNYGNAPIGYSPTGFAGAPMQTQPATPDVFSGQPLGAPQGFGNWGNQDVGYPSGGFNTQPNVATDMSLAGLSPVGQNVAGVGYNPAAVAAASPIGAPSMRGMSFDDVTRGITGYTTTTTPTTVSIPNPAYADWQEAFNNPRATPQQMYADDLADKLGVNRGNFATPAQVAQYGPRPSPTIEVPGKPTVTRSPVYGDVPVGQPIGANLTGAGAGSWTSGLSSLANSINAQINDFSNFGLQGFTGSFNTGLSPVGYGGGIGSLGSLGGGPANVGSGWGLGGEAGGLGGTAGAAGFSGGDAGYGSDARSGRDGADQRND